MIYHLDEHVSERFTELAERRGLDVTSIDRLGLKCLDDASNILLAAQTSRVLVTYDVRLHVAAPSVAGMVVNLDG